MSEQSPDFGPGSGGKSFAPAPGWTYSGDGWCNACASYVPAEGSHGPHGPVYRLAAHGCRGDHGSATQSRQHEEESE